MGWKNLSAWLKGGIIGGLIITIMLTLLPLISDTVGKYLRFIYLPGTYISILTNNFTLDWGQGVPLKIKLFEILLFSAVNILFYFIIGALIGWIIGKIKSKK